MVNNSHQEGQPELHQDVQDTATQKRTKHIDVKYHFVQERVEDETVKLQYCPTEIMEADLLTKAHSKVKVDQHRRTLMGCSPRLGKPIQPEWG